jgi:hypothetical protein
LCSRKLLFRVVEIIIGCCCPVILVALIPIKLQYILFSLLLVSPDLVESGLDLCLSLFLEVFLIRTEIENELLSLDEHVLGAV